MLDAFDLGIHSRRNEVTYLQGKCKEVRFREGTRHAHRPDFITDDDVFLPGFVDEAANVTYESHDFWIRFPAGVEPLQRFPRMDCEVFVLNGMGVQSLGVEYHMALPLKALVDAGNLEAAYHMCWGLHDLARRAREIGQTETQRRIYEAFVDGRLKKRKKRGSTMYQVTIDPRRGAEE